MPAAPTVTLPLPGLGPLSVTVAADPVTGLTRYALHGRHLHGVVLVEPHQIADELLPTGARVLLGEGPPPVRPYTARPHEPVVHAVRVHGTATCSVPDRLPDPNSVLFEGTVLGEHYRTHRVPDAARDRLEAALAAVLDHWRTSPERPALVLAAARRNAPAAARTARAALESATAELATLTAQIRRSRSRLARLRKLSATPPPTTAPPGRTARLALTGPDGRSLGIARVREIAVNHPPGTVIYRVDGARLAGSVALSPYQHSTEPVPGGITARCTADTPADAGDGRTEHLLVNGIRLSGTWHHHTSRDISPSAPAALSTPYRAEPHSSRPVPDSTKNRWWALLRALAVHYISSPDNHALRLAAAQQRAARLTAAELQTLTRLRSRRSAVTAARTALRERLDACSALT